MKFLRVIEKILWNSKRSVVQKNLKFKDIHKGETCLIFGNAGSLKYYDFSALPEIPAIGCSYSLTDKRTNVLNLQYCVISDPYLLYPIRHNKTHKTLQRNMIGPIMRKLILNNKGTTFFTSLTNYFGFFKTPENLNFFYHFGDKTSSSYDLGGKFAVSRGALHIMIGVAKYLGFSKAILLGCDYLGSPKLEGHFYAYAAPFIGIEDIGYREGIKKIADGIEILCVFPKGIQSPDFESVCFEEYFNSPEIYRENHEFIDPEYLKMMQKCLPYDQICL